MSAPVTPRRCVRRPLDPNAPRPSFVLARFFAAALLHLLVGAAFGVDAALTGDPQSRWIALHLLLLGGVSQLVLGAAQFFVCAFLQTTPPPERLTYAQLGVWNLGTLLVVAGVPGGHADVATFGGLLLAVGLGLLAAAFATMQRRALRTARWAVRWYEASALFLAAGVLAGVAMARGMVWTAGGTLLGAHMALNLAGWMGAAIVGTLHTFFPSLTQTALRHERLQGPTFVAWTIGVTELAAGAALGSDVLVVAGWVALACAALALGVNLVASLVAAPAAPSLSALLVAAGQLFLPAGLTVALVLSATQGAGAITGAARPPLAVLLVAGWIGLTVAGSLLHLLSVLARVRDFSRAMPPRRPRRDAAIAATAVVGVAGLALAKVDGLAGLAPVAGVWCAAVAVVVAALIARQAVRALVHRPAT